jgi:hypothetical protein
MHYNNFINCVPKDAVVRFLLGHHSDYVADIRVIATYIAGARLELTGEPKFFLLTRGILDC